MTTTMFKWTRALSREGFMTTKFYFSDLHKSSYYVNQIVRPIYIVIISNDNDISEFSSATDTFDMSFAVWLVLFVYKGHDPDYCHNPPDNIFHLRFDSHLMVRCGTDTILREWYSIKTNQTEIRDLATLNLKKGVTKIISNSLYDRNYNLQGLTMRAVLVKTSPFVHINEAGELDGLLGRMLMEFSITLNFSFEIVSEIETYGTWNPENNTWSGAIGELYSGRGDISLSGFSMTNARLNAVDFTFPFVTSKFFLYIQEPEIFTIKWTSYFTFSRSIWITIFAVLILAWILLIFLKVKIRDDCSMGQLLSDNFLEVWGIFCQQGLKDFPERSSLRIAYFSIILLATILLATYSASLISYLTAGIHILPFNSLESFVQDNTYQLCVLRDSAEYDTFANSNGSLEKNLKKLMLDKEKLPISIPEGFVKVCNNHKLAILTSKIVKDILVRKSPCNIVSVDTGRLNAVGIILSKRNPFTHFINFHFKKFINNGMNNRIRDILSEKEYNDITKHQPVYITSKDIFLLVKGRRCRWYLDCIQSIELLEFCDVKRQNRL
uniref:probable glutamate receptor n=1 Tax=Vespula vulgaris TaxID=7454 RepID=UPI00223C0164|nr:probable glutamate receptor [Vespula vulgaris]